jgi:tripartite-type tricarboxylate transporter receptor subunit TctC
MKRRIFLQATGLTLVFSGTGALAQEGTLRMVVPLPAGSSNDTSTRVISGGLGPLLGQTIVVENKPGASGVIATMDVIRSKPDGLTLLAGSLSPLAANVAFVKDLPYDPLTDLTPVAGSTLTNHVLVVAPDSPITTFPEFIEYAKAHPGEVTVGYSTAIAQLQIITMNQMAGIELLAVPYQGAPASVTDVMGGVLTSTLANTGPTIEYERAGRLRPLGVSSLERNPLTPDWPAFSETLPGFDFPSWNAFVGPVGMDPAVVARLSEAIAEAQRQPEVVEQLGREATLPLIMGPDELKAYMASEVAKYVDLAGKAGIEPQ